MSILAYYDTAEFDVHIDSDTSIHCDGEIYILKTYYSGAAKIALAVWLELLSVSLIGV
jgi:hypothetical protein